MAENKNTPTRVQPVDFFDSISQAELEREIGARASKRFSLTALKAALYAQHMGKMDQPDGYARTQGYCGDLMSFYLRVENGHIPKITFTTDGCDATIASGEMLASLVAGMALEEAERVTPKDLLAALDGLPPNHIHCAELAVSTLHAAIENYREGH